MNSSAPELQGVQTVPLHPVPKVLLTALGRQGDLSLVLQTKSVEVFSNSLFHGIVSETVPGETSPTPIFSSAAFTGLVTPGAIVQAGVAPANAFGLDVDGQAASRAIDHLWTPIFHVSATAGSGDVSGPTGTLVLHRLPLNALLAAFTLLIWALVFLGFGWVHRLEWLVTGRRKPTRPRHAKDDHE